MPARSRRDLRVIACLFCILFLGVADNQVVSPLLPAIRERFNISSSKAGLLYTGYAFCAALSVLVWGPVSDLFGRRRGLRDGLIVFCAGSCVSSLSGSFILLLAGRVLTGIGASMLSLNTISYAADFFPYAQRGWAMSSIFSSYFAALILGVPLGSWLGDRFGWNFVFGCMAAASLVSAAFVQFILPGDTTAERRQGIQISECIGRYIGFFKNKISAGALMSSFFASAGTMGFLAFLGVWLHDSFGVPSSKIGLAFLVAGAAALLASPLAGSIADRVGKRLQFIVSSAALAVLLTLLPNLRWGMPLFAAFGLVSLAAAFRQGPMEAVLTEIVPSVSRGSFVALKNSFSQLGIGIAALFSGILFESHGYAGVCGLGAVACLLAAGAMLSTLGTRDL